MGCNLTYLTIYSGLYKLWGQGNKKSRSGPYSWTTCTLYYPLRISNTKFTRLFSAYKACNEITSRALSSLLEETREYIPTTFRETYNSLERQVLLKGPKNLVLLNTLTRDILQVEAVAVGAGEASRSFMVRLVSGGITIYRGVFIFGSLLIWACTVLQDGRSPLMQFSCIQIYFLQKCA